MKALDLGCLTSALGLVGTLLDPSPACARDTAVAEKTAHPISTAPAIAAPAIATVEPLAPSAANVAGLDGGGAVGASAASSNEPIDSLNPDPIRVDITTPDATPVEASCDKACELSSSSEISLLPRVVMRTLVEMPVVGTFLITPVTTGVTVAPVEGLPALTFAVKPTKIAQGSGLVAIGRF